MSVINVLEPHIANLIAAGEVVERPASVIKELLENAVDAEATSITVEIKNGGTTFMRVTDNGGGIERSQLPTAFLRHATSKIRTKDDLTSIGTLGFRGEALAAISSVSKIEIMTKTEKGEGARAGVVGGKVEDVSDCGCPDGTTIIVRDLFFNTPARMKFLKKDITEGAYISSIVEKVALSHPEMSFRFIKDGKNEFVTPGDGRLESAVHVVWGSETGRGMIAVDYTLEPFSGLKSPIKVTGMTAKPHMARANRSLQWFYINNRCVQSRTIAAAAEEAYRDLIPSGKFPVCVLFLEVNLSLVDVNIHPAKLEVKFADEKSVFDAVYFAVKNAITAKTQPLQAYPKVIVPEMNNPQQQQQYQEDKSVEPKAETVQTLTLKSTATVTKEIADLFKIKTEFLTDTEPAIQPTLPQAVMQNTLDDEPNTVEICTEPKPYRIIGELFNTYIIVECESDLLLIDKHAAHERIIYEGLKFSDHGRGIGQMLLEPEIIRLPRTEKAAVLNNSSLLSGMGFVVEDFGSGDVIVRSIPANIDKESGTDMLYQLAAGIAAMGGDDVSVQSVNAHALDKVLYTCACKAAIKARSPENALDAKTLCERVMGIGDIMYCPHGRPVVIKMSKYQIDKQFYRN